MIADLMTRPCRIITVTQVPANPAEPRYDDMGMPIVEDDMGQTVSVENVTETVCELQQSTAKEIRDGGITDVTEWMLFLPAGIPLSASDRVEVEDLAFSVEGAPWPVRHPRTGQEHHIEAHVRLVQ